MRTATKLVIATLLTIIGAGFIFGFNVLSLQALFDETILHVWWGVFIATAAILGLAICICVSVNAVKGRACTALSGLLPAGCVVLLLLSQWYMKEYSIAKRAEDEARIVEGVTPVLLEKALSDENNALLKFSPNTGYVQSDGADSPKFKKVPAFTAYEFEAGCGGSYQPESAGGAEGYWSYPETCPGVEVVLAAPLWYSREEANGDQGNQSIPAAIVFQVYSGIFKHATSRHVYIQKLEEGGTPFKLADCGDEAEGEICALNPYNAQVQKHWEEWHKLSNETAEEGVGRYEQPTRKSLETEMNRVQEAAQLQMNNLGFGNRALPPLLWVPADENEEFVAYYAVIEQSRKNGPKAKIFLVCAISLFVLTVVGYCSATLCGKACCDKDEEKERMRGMRNGLAYDEEELAPLSEDESSYLEPETEEDSEYDRH
eukprot:gnl/TRDRNA2_/TRDRNA2_41986_c0_seq1.p1 gnl/TRDRNA2_/TRDRNA2_41986_c0~~gnl/TRDRNA2_/TRDRNA2_41986_c0_seq1.p1  ORF type:complete len:430 (+),score=94.12 gnl/TRDRNA2_/TRDRNA2_41986_c0_seq1:94-1383(+)